METPDALIDSVETQDMVGSPRRLSRRAWLAITGAACALIPLSWGAIRWLRPSQFEAAVERLRAAGEPVSFDDLRRLYDEMPSRNAEIEAILERVFAAVTSADYQAAARGLPAVDAHSIDAPPPLGAPWQTIATAEDFLIRFRPVVDDLRRLAAHNGAAQLGFDVAQPFAIPRHLIPAIVAMHGLLWLEAAVAMHRADTHRLTEVVLINRRLAILASDIPNWTAVQIRLGWDQSPMSHLQASLPFLRWSDADLTRLAAAFAPDDHRLHLRHALLGCRVAVIDALRDPVRNGAPSWLRWSPFADSDKLTGLNSCNRAIDATELSWPEIYGAMAAASVPIPARWTWLSELQIGRSARFVKSIDALANTAASAQVNELLATTAIAVERYRRAHGDVPQTAEALVPEFLAEAPIDPFDGQPLRYKLSETELVIYSIGPDRNDDGGASTSDTPGYDEPDLVLRLPLARWSASP